MKAVHAVVVLLMAFGLIAHAETNIRFAPDIEKSAGAEDLVALRAGLEKTVRPRLMAATASSKTPGTTVTATGDLGYVRGRGSLYFYFDVPASLKSVTSARVSMNSYDVDYPSAIEHDKVYFNGTYIGRLQGYNNGWEINTFAVPASSVKIGQSNTMRIDVDVENTGWVTGSKDIVLYLNGEEGEIGLSASNGLKDRIDLSWTANFSGTTFNAYRGSTPESLAIYQEGLTEMTFSDTSVTLGETYYYQVMSRTGISSGIVEGRCQDGSITLLATTAYYHEIRLMWNPDNCEGPYTIYRGSRVDDLAPLAYDVDDMSYTDDSIGNGESFYYRVVAANGIVSDVVKGESKEQTITVTPSTDRPDEILVEWKTTGPQPSSYTIQRIVNEEVVATFDNITGNAYVDTGAPSGQTVKYEVFFQDVKGNGRGTKAPKEAPKVKKWTIPLESEFINYEKYEIPLVAGCEAHCDIELNDYDRDKYQIAGAVLIGRKRSDTTGHLLMWIQSGADVKEVLKCAHVNKVDLPMIIHEKSWLEPGDKTKPTCIHVYGHLNSGSRSFHGNLSFQPVVVYKKVDDRTYFAAEGNRKGNKVYFKVAADDDADGIPNWFAYWKDDGACPGLRGGVEYAGESQNTLGRYAPQSEGVEVLESHTITVRDKAGKSWGGVPQYRVTGTFETAPVKLFSGAREYHHNFPSENHNGVEFSNPLIYGISTVEAVLAHEREHERIEREYFKQRKAFWEKNIGKLNAAIKLYVEQSEGGLTDSELRDYRDETKKTWREKLEKEFDSDCNRLTCEIVGATATEKFCRTVTKEVEYFIRDSLSNDEERDWNKNRKIGNSPLDENDLDTFKLHLWSPGDGTYPFVEYEWYGDNEYLARLAARAVEFSSKSDGKPLKRVNSAKPGNDWAYPGSQAGGIPANRASQAKKSLRAVLKAAGQEVDPVDKEMAFKLLSISGNASVSGVVYDVSVEVTGPISFRMVAFLRGAESDATVSAEAHLGHGVNTTRLVFSGDDIYSSGIAGPYQLDHVEVWTTGYNTTPAQVGDLVDFTIPEVVFDIENFEHKGAKWVGDVYDERKTEDGLEVKTSLNVFVPGAYDIYAELSTTNGEAIAGASFRQELTQGTNEVSILFANADIFSSRTDGPYAITRLRLLKDGEPVHAIGDVYVTENEYRYVDFIPSDAVVVADADSCVLELDGQSSEGACSDIVLRLDVMNESSQSLPYNVHVSLFATNDELVASFDRRYLYLTNGLNKVAAVFKSADVRAVGIDGPYHVKGVELRPSENGSNDATFRTRVESPAYKASDFAAASVAFSGETARVERADDSLVVAFDYETTRGCTVVAAATLVDTNGNFVARAYSTNVVRHASSQTARLEFSWQDLSKDNVGGPYRVAYFSLTPLGTGEAPLVSDSLEIRDIDWLTPTAQPSVEIPEGVDWDALYTWDVTNGTAVAKRYRGADAHDVVVVPSEYDGLPVTRIEKFCFLSNLTVKAVVVSEGISTIGPNAFRWCESLKTVVLPDSVESIENRCFSYCTSLERVYLPPALQEIGEDAFVGDVSLEALWIPQGVLNIPEAMCWMCSNLVMVAMPPVVTNVENAVFKACPKLRSARLPSGFKVLPSEMFRDSVLLESLELPDTLEAIGNYSVLTNDTLTEIVIPPEVTNIGTGAFLHCTAVTNFIFRGPPPEVGAWVFPKNVPARYPLTCREAWEAVIVNGLWNGLQMYSESVPPRIRSRTDIDEIVDESTFEGGEWSFSSDGTRSDQCLRSARIGNGQHTDMAVVLTGGGVVTFDWRTSCEGATANGSLRDHAEFLVDGAVVAVRDGESVWSRVSFVLEGEGEHTVTWRYAKDGSGSAREDCVWVSDVKFESISDEETSDELLDESEYNWFYEDTPVSVEKGVPFEYSPRVTPEDTTSQVDFLVVLGGWHWADVLKENTDDMQAAVVRVADAKGLEYAALTADGWVMVGNESIVLDESVPVKVSLVFDYAASPSTIKYMISGHTLTNAAGVSTFVCKEQKTSVSKVIVRTNNRVSLEAWAGKYEVANSDVQEVAAGTETELAANLDTFSNETFRVSGGGTLVIPGDKIPADGVNRKLHVDANSAVTFDLSGIDPISTVTRLFNGVGNSFAIGENMKLIVPGEGEDRVSKLFVKDGNLEARVAERPVVGDEETPDGSFRVNVDGDTSTAAMSVGNAVEGFWYGLLTTDLLTSDFLLDRDSVRQCPSTGPLKLESSANANSHSGFYRVSVSADKPD